jgi:outer membrane murein-binding lipoprotein Lpp
MRINLVTAVVLGVLLMSGCGDQVWCGENGCTGKKIVSTSAAPMNVQNAPILENIL